MEVPVGLGTRYRCAACGNLTRFDVVTSRRTRAFHHFSVGGELTIEEETVLDERVEEVTCRWCGATGHTIQALPDDALPDQARADEARADEAVAES